ncbi:MAG: alpha/beta fold hydrolase [Bacteroidales bacterium]|nr:alpha/beta fold hydrolase [Bacteroidales bacterium]
MNQLSRYISIILVISVLYTCKQPSQAQVDSEWNYQEFRASQKSFLSSDGTIKYIDKGEGKTILLLHGIPTSSWLYRKMIEGLVEGGFRVIAPDMLGFGSSDNPEGYQIYSPEEHAGRIIELMEYLEINSWTHVMHDAGGIWTWELFKRSPDKISSLILLNTIIYEAGFNPPIKMKEGAFAKFSMWLYKNGVTTNSLLKQLFKKGLKKNTLSKNEIEGYKKPLLEGKTNAMYNFFTGTCNNHPNYDTVISNVNIPVAVIWGKYDEMLLWEPQKEKVIRELKIQLKNVHIIEAKHFIQEELPEEINSLIISFLEKN